MAYYSPASNKSFPPQNLAASSSSSIISNNSPGHQHLPVVVKEKSPQKKTPTRNRGGQNQRKVATLSPGDASSSEALASTIASVASGGGSLEEFEKFSAATSLGSSSNSSPSSLFTNSLNIYPGPSSFSEQLSTPHNIIQAPISSKRRKNCSGSSSALNSAQSSQKLNSMLLTDSQLNTHNQMGMMVERSKKVGPISSSQYHHVQEVQQQQCRIHVQNPPQTGDFPMTGTKIQVVHMQPSPAAASISLGACDSPQQLSQCSPHQQQHYVGIGSMLPPPRSQHHEIISNHYHPSQHPTHHHSLPATPFSETGLDFCCGGVAGTGGVSAEMILSSSATATPSPAATIASSPAMMPPTPGCVGGPPSVQSMHKIQQKIRGNFHQQHKQILDNGGGPMSVGCNSSNSYPPPSPLWVSHQQSSAALSAQASPQPSQHHQYVLQKKIENSGSMGGNSNVSSLLSMPSASPYSQQQQIRQNHQQQYSPMSVPLQSITSGEASADPSPQMIHRFHQNTPHYHQSSPPQILTGGPHLQQQTPNVGLPPQAIVGSQNLNQQATFASQQVSLPGQQLQPSPIYHKQLQHQVHFHNQTHQQPQHLPLHYLQTQPSPTPPQQQLISHQHQYHNIDSTIMPIERPTAPLPTQQHMHPPPSPMFSSIKQQLHNANVGNHHAVNVPPNHSIYLSQQQQPSQTHLKQHQLMPHSPHLHQQQPIVLQQQMQHHSFQQPIISSPPPYVANAYPSQHPHPQQIRMFPPSAPPQFVCPVTPTGPLHIAGCSSSSQMLPPQPQPARAQLSRAQLLDRNSQRLKCHKYAVKLYHLQRTTKALVYKNGALADELTRLHQQIQIVTEERRVLAKRLQHHERNRIRRLQTYFKKAAAAASAAEAEKKNDTEGGTTTNCKKLAFCTLVNSKQKKHNAQINCKDSHINTDKVNL